MVEEHLNDDVVIHRTNVYQIRHGRIVEIRIVEADQHAVDEHFGGATPLIPAPHPILASVTADREAFRAQLPEQRMPNVESKVNAAATVVRPQASSLPSR